MSLIQYSLLPPLSHKDDSYYETFLDDTVYEISLLCEKYDSVIVAVYDLIDEPDRTTDTIRKTIPRVMPEVFLKSLRQKIATSDLCLSNRCEISYRLFRAIRENETEELFLEWFRTVGDEVADSFVIVGNYKNKLFRTDDALLCLKNDDRQRQYGTVLILHRTDELCRTKKRVGLGVTFFNTQIVVDANFVDLYKDIFSFLESFDVFISVTIVKSVKIWNLLTSLGVVSYSNFEQTIGSDSYNAYTHLGEIINSVRHSGIQVSFELLNHTKKYRLRDLNKFLLI